MLQNKTENKVTIITHNSNFHTDDIFAVATLLLVLKNEEVQVIRSRDENIIEKGDYVVDVGGIYAELKNRFDHHQEGGAGVRANTIPYASFGLVWKKFGEELSGNREIAEKVDQILVQWIDASDNGMDLIETKIPGIYPYDIGLFFNTFTPDFKEPEADLDSIFMELVVLAKRVLEREILKRKNLLEARSIIEKAYREAPDKRLIIFDTFYPSREFLSQFPEPLFTVFPQNDGHWAVKTIRNNGYSFVNRKSLPKEWAGKKDDELEMITGVRGAIFCHRALFLAVAKTKEAALKLAEIALNS